MFSAIVPLILGLAALAARLAGSMSPQSIEVEWHFVAEPVDFNVECVVDPKNGEMPEGLGPNRYKITVPPSHRVTIKSAKIFDGRWCQDFVVTPSSPERRRAYSAPGSYAQAGEGPGEKGARYIILLRLLK